MRRRAFLEGCGHGLAGLLAAQSGARNARAFMLASQEILADVVIIGGGLGGCAAALAALRAGRTVVLTEPTDWIGGQLTSQAVPPDEHPWIEQFGSSASYRALRTGIRDYYRQHYPLTAEARATLYFNPGSGNVSKLCHEPRVALAVLTDMLAPYCSSRRLQVLLEHEPIRADTQGDRVRAVTVKNRTTGRERTLLAPYFVDATELGDLLPLARAEFVTGAEGQDQTAEPHAPSRAEPSNQQSFTCCFAIDYLDGEDHTIERPAEYDAWKAFVPTLRPGWPGRLLDLLYSDPVTLKPITRGFDPRGAGQGLWAYRRIIDPRHFQSGSYPDSSGTTLVNWPQNDYWLGPLVGSGISTADADRHIARAKQLSLSLLYWLQTECPRPDGKNGWKGLRLRPDLLGTDDGLAKAPYIRESRRIEAEFTVIEQHIGTDARRRLRKSDDVVAETFADSIGVGSYRIDLHPSTSGDNYIDISSLPFQIPLGSLIPRRLENLLPACKNLGTTHITNGCYRLHPVEWAIGEAAGALAAFSIEEKVTPRAVRNTPRRLSAFQARLVGQGVDIAWPRLRRSLKWLRTTLPRAALGQVGGHRGDANLSPSRRMRPFAEIIFGAKERVSIAKTRFAAENRRDSTCERRGRCNGPDSSFALNLDPGRLEVATSNPAFSNNMFAGYEQVYGSSRSTAMTVQGTAVKTIILLAIMFATATWSWNALASGDIAFGVVLVSLIGGFVTSLITIFKPTLAPVTAPIYAAFEGVFLGAISQVIQIKYGERVDHVGGIVMQAVSLTAGVLFVMMFVYATRIIRVTAKLQMAIVVATGALALFYMVSILLRLAGYGNTMMYAAKPVGIGFSLFVVGLAAFNLLLDFDFIEKSAQNEAPKFMEWYGAFGLMVTLVWLYLEILRLLMKLADRR